ncbi:MAG: rRNA methyltransferase [Burkholderiales bacterium]|jgi:23S rRNA (uridine2552-2'-O)-methyltransferase|nr:rRNA methyltransferase [Burkholderiales bacterium]
MAKNRFVKAWIHEHVNNHYVKSAVLDGYRSRAAYKLLEIDQKFDLFKNVKKVVDLGCAPGSWSQVILQKIGSHGVAVGVDLLETIPIKGLHFIKGDFTENEVLAKLVDAIGDKVVDLVVSDMSPNLSGVRGVDQARGAYLIELVLEFAKDYLITGGKCIIKVFHGGEFDNLVKNMRELFEQVVIFKPDASRSKSSETYLLGLNKHKLV